MKRALDVMLSLMMLILFSPLLVFVAIWIRLDSEGAILYCQKRVGLNGRVFSIYKFRSMVVDADQVGGYSTTQDDPRITRVGKFLRKTSIDELPQLLNVLKSDMSLVGPRPDVPAQQGNYTEAEWNKRNLVKPGITGLAQATVRSQATAAERTKLDLEYVDEVSFWFDVKILLMTLKQVMGKGGF